MKDYMSCLYMEKLLVRIHVAILHILYGTFLSIFDQFTCENLCERPAIYRYWFPADASNKLPAESVF